MINIGTYLRCAAVDQVVYAFVLGQDLPGLAPDKPITLRPFVPAEANVPKKGAGPVQIISLGAGNDSRFWKLKVRLLSLVISGARGEANGGFFGRLTQRSDFEWHVTSKWILLK